MTTKQSLKIEHLEPTNIASEAPSEQRIREPNQDGGETQNGGDESQNGGIIRTDEENDFVQVYSTVKEETTFKKGDVKLQKVTVAENVSEDTALKKLPDSFFSGIYEEVIAGPQLIRTPGPEGEDMSPEVVEDGDTETEQEKKSKTRIPMKMRFQQLADKVKKEKGNEIKEEKQVPKAHPRRSSIPRLKKVNISQKHRENNENNNNESQNHDEIAKEETKTTNNEEALPLEEEFDKIYDEIIVSDENVPVIDPSTLVGKITDAEELEQSFEEIIHDYEENKVQPIEVKNNRSKIPLVKQKSQTDLKIMKKVDRRLSLKDISVDDNNKSKEYNKNNSNVVTTNSDIYKDTTNLKGKPDVTLKEKPAKAAMTAKESLKETVSVVYPHFDSHQKISTVDKTKKNDDSDKDANRLPNSSRLVKELGMSTLGSNNLSVSENTFGHRKSKEDEGVLRLEGTSEPEKYTDRKEKSSSLSEETNVPQTEIEIPNKQSIKSKIAIFNQPEESDKRKNMNKTRNILEDSVARLTVQNDKSLISKDITKTRQENNITPPNTPQIQESSKPIDLHKQISSNDNELSSPKLLNKSNEDIEIENALEINDNDETSNENLSIDKTNRLTKGVTILNSEEVAYNPTVDLKNTRDTDCVKTETQFEDKIKETVTDCGEVSNKNDIVPLEQNDDDFGKEKEFLKGNVSKIINRLVSVDDNIKASRNEIVDMPVKESVSSRIAIFERQTNQPTKFKKEKPTQKNFADSKPKIVDEVLKVQPRRLEHNSSDNNAVERIMIEITEQSENLKSITENDNGHKNDTALKEQKNIRHEAIILIDETIRHASSIIDVDLDKIENTSLNIENDLAFNAKAGDEVIKETAQRIIEKQRKRESDTKNDKVWKPKAVETYNIEDRLKQLRAKNEDAKSKTAIEVKIGEAVRGKVHHLIRRINSMEMLDVEKTEKSEKNIINTKERPRKKSVSEKIALFENKLVTVKMDTATEVAVASGETAPGVEVAPDTVPSAPVLTERQLEKIERLKNAKETYGSVDNMSYVTLRDGNKMPVLTLGTALLDTALLPHVISAAIDLGYRAIDTAYIYGNEKEIGDAIREKIATSNVTRKDLFIIGKLWSTFHRRDLVVKACQDSLKNLGLEYFDLYLVHNPMSFKEGGDPLPKIANVLQYSQFDYLDAWYGMEDLVNLGLAKSIGVSNFNSEQISRIMEKGKIKPSVNQVECHPYLSQRNLTLYCEDRSIKLMCFGVLGSKGTPSELKGSDASVIDDPMVKVLAAGSNMTAAQMLVRYQIDSGRAVLTKCSSAEHLWDTLQALGKRLDQTVLDGLNALNRNKRTYVFKGMGDTHRNYPFKIPF